jgi:hypothetical protein
MAVRKRELTKLISMRLSPEDARALEEIAGQVTSIPRLTIARLALRWGLAAFRDDPSRLLGVDQPRDRRRPTTSRRQRNG